MRVAAEHLCAHNDLEIYVSHAFFMCIQLEEMLDDQYCMNLFHRILTNRSQTHFESTRTCFQCCRMMIKT